MSIDVTSPAEERRARGQRIKAAADVRLPRLQFWNYEPCEHHSQVTPTCEFRRCGGDFWAHQRVGIAWMHVVKKGLLADVPGAGKTNQILGLAALLKERGELTGRMLIVCQTPSVLQWWEEAARWVPSLSVQAAYSGLSKAKRINKYVSNWDILIVGHHMAMQDADMLEQLEPATVVIDDVDPALDHDNVTHKVLVRLTDRAERAIFINATSMQTRLQQLHAASMTIGGFTTFGSLGAFERRYVRQDRVVQYSKRGTKTQRIVTLGYKNMDEFRSKFGPMVLRRNYEALTDIRMPEVMPPENVWLDLHPEQHKRYAELQDGVMRLIREEGTQVKHANALTKITYGGQICAGLPALGEPDGPKASVKMDWLEKRLTEGPWAEDSAKVIVFIKNVGIVKAMRERLAKHGLTCAIVWGQGQNAVERKAEIDKFWNDPTCRVFMGTSAMERSLNLQVSNIVVNFDSHMNPSRMLQILGRSRRGGSRHSHVFVFNLFTRDTQEEKYLPVLESRQAVADFVWSEQNDLYRALSGLELLQLIQR